MRYFLAILAILISYIILSGIIVGAIFKGNVHSGGGLFTAFIMIPVAIFLWKVITRKKEK
jgi:ABC-type transport system involved in cytochrome bd biosynthesis fused ATPase/permease subunit